MTHAPIATLVARKSDKFTEYPFEINKAIIAHFIYNQGSNIQKALMELVMNAIDAQATRISLTIHSDRFVCEDNGVGFKTLTEIEKHFRTFGTPHLEGDAKYGRFRLGRGQIMAFAHTIWQSHEWVMNVKIKNQKEPSFGLSTTDQIGTKPYSGCKITGIWEKPLEEWHVTKIVNNLRVLMKFIPITIQLNNEMIGFDISTKNMTWTCEDENAYYYITESTQQQRFAPLQIFNMGIFVSEYPKYQYGVSGIILTKKAIKLNTSRTSVMSDQCPVWAQIRKKIYEFSESSRKKSKIWDMETKTYTMQQMLDHEPETFELFATAPLIPLVGSSRSVSISRLFSKLERPEFHGITICPSKNSLPHAEIIAKNKNICVIHPNIYQIFQDIDDGSTPYIKLLSILTYILPNIEEHREKINKEIIDSEERYEKDVILYETHWLTRIDPESVMRKTELLDFQTIVENLNLNSDTQIVNPKDVLSKDERRVWFSFKTNLARYVEKLLANYIPTDKDVWPIVILGDSPKTSAWTDGVTYIAFSKQLIKKIASNPPLYAEQIFNIATHEAVHFGSSSPSQNIEHDLEFYKIFHDITLQSTALRNTHVRKALSSYRYRLHEELKHLIYPNPYYNRKKNELRHKKTRGLIHGRIAYHYDILAMRLALSDTYQFVPDTDEETDRTDATSLLTGSLPDGERTSTTTEIEKILTEKLSSIANPNKTQKEKENEIKVIRNSIKNNLISKVKESIKVKMKDAVTKKIMSNKNKFYLYIKAKNPRDYFDDNTRINILQELTDPLSYAKSSPEILRQTILMVEATVLDEADTNRLYHRGKYSDFARSLSDRITKITSTFLKHTPISNFPSIGQTERWTESILNCFSITDLSNEFIEIMISKKDSDDSYFDDEPQPDYTDFNPSGESYDISS